MNIYGSIEGLREQFTGRFSDFSFHFSFSLILVRTFVFETWIPFSCKTD